MRFMGIDYGTRRIGVAISDPLCTMAHPLDVIDVRKDNSHIERIRDIAKGYNITHVIVGLPYNMDGSIGDCGKSIIEWSRQLENGIGLPVTLWDERLTTYEAQDLLTRSNVRRRRQRQVRDKIAAGFILKGYLDSLNT